MSRQFTVAHVSKYTASNFSSGGLGRHIDREHVPENARIEDQGQNFELVTSSEKMGKDIELRLSEGYKGKTAIRKDAVRSCGVIFSGSHEQMKEIESTGLIDEWAKDSYDFACDTWGKENIIRATVHLDEKTPHMHLHFVPLTKDGRLSAKEIISKQNLKALQNDYANLMQSYGLERGIEGSKKKHITTKQHYQRLHESERDAQAIMEHPNAKEILQTLLQENQKLKKQEAKQNPDKANSYENTRAKTTRSEDQQSRGSETSERGKSKTKSRNFGPSL